MTTFGLKACERSRITWLLQCTNSSPPASVITLRDCTPPEILSPRIEFTTLLVPHAGCSSVVVGTQRNIGHIGLQSGLTDRAYEIHSTARTSHENLLYFTVSRQRKIEGIYEANPQQQTNRILQCDFNEQLNWLIGFMKSCLQHTHNTLTYNTIACDSAVSVLILQPILDTLSLSERIGRRAIPHVRTYTSIFVCWYHVWCSGRVIPPSISLQVV